MRLLLDTHILLWWLTQPRKLPAAVRSAIADPQNQVRVSVAGLWEMAIKRSLGRVDYPDDLVEILSRGGIGVLPVEAHHAMAVASLPMLHQDPFDRIQVVQAQFEGFTIVTRDRAIPRYEVKVLVA